MPANSTTTATWVKVIVVLKNVFIIDIDLKWRTRTPNASGLFVPEMPVAVTVQKLLQLTRGCFFGYAIAHLRSGGLLILPASHLTPCVKGELAPLFIHPAAERSQSSLQTISVHVDLLIVTH